MDRWALPWVVFALASASCGGKVNETSPCRDAFERLQRNLEELRAIKGQAPPEAIDAAFEKMAFKGARDRCQADHWPEEVILCAGDAATMGEFSDCTSKLSELQRAKLDEAAALVRKSKEDYTAATVKRLAGVGFQLWTLSYPDEPCPADFDALRPHLEGTHRDPWGHPFRMFCGANLPAGAKGLALISDGPDGQPDTDDDIRSW